MTDLSFDARTQFRVGLDEEHVTRMASVYADPETAGKVPPIEILWDRKAKANYCWDGHHRVAGAKRAGLVELPCFIMEGTIRQAIESAAGANLAHGLPRSRADNRRAVEILLAEPCWAKRSDRWIAEKIGVTHPTVAKIRAELDALARSRKLMDEQRQAALEITPVGQVVNLPPDEIDEAAEESLREGKDGKTYAAHRQATQDKDSDSGDEIRAKMPEEVRKALGVRLWSLPDQDLRRLLRLWNEDPKLTVTTARMLKSGEVETVQEALAESAVVPDEPDASQHLRAMLEKTRSVWRMQFPKIATNALGAAVLEAVAEEWLTQ